MVPVAELVNWSAESVRTSHDIRPVSSPFQAHGVLEASAVHGSVAAFLVVSNLNGGVFVSHISNIGQLASGLLFSVLMVLE